MFFPMKRLSAAILAVFMVLATTAGVHALPAAGPDAGHATTGHAGHHGQACPDAGCLDHDPVGNVPMQDCAAMAACCAAIWAPVDPTAVSFPESSSSPLLPACKENLGSLSLEVETPPPRI